MSIQTPQEKIKALRAMMKDYGIDAYYVPREDEHNNEYVPDRNERLAWLTDFTGSAGMAVITQDSACVFVNGIYTIQANAQIDKSIYSIRDYTNENPFEWACKQLGQDKVLGLNAKTTLCLASQNLEKITQKSGVQVQYMADNLIDQIWEDRPAPEGDDIFIFDEKFAGESFESKIKRISKSLLEDNGCDYLPMAELGNNAWLLNLRGSDISINPFFFSYGLLEAKKETLHLFVDLNKLPEEVKNARQSHVQFYAYDDFAKTIATLGLSGTCLIDRKEHSVWIKQLMEANGVTISYDRNPITYAKSSKNKTEQDNIREAHKIDGAALCKFFKWFEEEASKGHLNEYDVTENLYNFRAENNAFRGVSFPPISGYAANGALPHYRVEKETALDIKGNGLYLLDSGGQYLYGTTDLTRVVPIGTPDADMKKYFTAVLKGHIAFARATFPEGTTGGQLDVIARKPLWDIGADYGHGTGHGVGMYLSVHEGPVRYSKARFSDEANNSFIPGAVISNEPGFYREGAFGIRIENLVIIKEAEERFEDGRKKYYFETISFVPIEKTLIQRDMLDDQEVAWLNDYHAKVYKNLAPGIQEDASLLKWLANKTAPLA